MGTPSKASPPPIIVTSNFKGGYASTDTISKENILHEQTNLPTIFEKKQLALNYLKKHKNLYLFSEDLNEKGVKRFIVTTYEKIYEVSKKKIFHLYENIEDRQLVKLHLDIDVKENKMCKMINRDNYLDQLIVVATSLVNNELELYGIDDPKYTVQTANREDKLSAHIIYPKVHFKTIHHMKHFMIKLKSPLIDKKILDLAIYRVGCFRLLFNSKYGKNNILIPHEKTRNNKKLFMDSLITNILPKSTLVKIKLPSNKIVCKSKTKKSSLKNHTSKEDVPLKKLEKLVSLLNKERVDDYKIWIDVGMSLYNCNSDSFNIWRKWSKQSSKFDRNTCIYKWNTFAKSNKTIGTLKYLAKQDSPDEYGDMDCTLEKVKYDTIKFNRPYLLEMTKDKKIKTVKNLIGCEKIYFGVESGSQNVLDLMKKGTKVEQIYNAANLCRQLGIEFHFFMMVGYPGETFVDLKLSLDLLTKTLPDSFSTSIAYPLYGTDFYEIVKENIHPRVMLPKVGENQLIFQREGFNTRYYHWIQRLFQKEWQVRRCREGYDVLPLSKRINDIIGLFVSRFMVKLLG